jgi:hypothetical protein
MEGKSNAKMAKNEGRGYRTVGLALAPHKMAGIGNLCTFATRPCINGCLNVAGRTGAEDSAPALNIFRGRIARARLYYQDRARFLEMLVHELAQEYAKAQADGEILIVRLNVLSDIDWPCVHPEVVKAFSDAIFYGYTKNPHAFRRFIEGAYPSNYYLTFSRSDANEAEALEFLRAGHNIAVIFDTKYTARMARPLPATFRGFPVIDGDVTDLRFADPRGVVVGLRAKGRLRRAEFQRSGFVVRTDHDHLAPRVID